MIPPWIIEDLERAEQEKREREQPCLRIPCMESLYERADDEARETGRGVSIVDISPRSSSEIAI